MADDQQAENIPEKENQDSPMPSEEQITQEPEEVAEKLPDEAKERTRKEFDKLKARLREAEEKSQRAEQALQGYFGQKQSTKPKKKLYDPTTGYLDPQALDELQAQAERAEQRAQRAESELKAYRDESQEREAVAAYPQLNKKADDYDEEFQKRAEAFLIHSMVNPLKYGGRTLTYREAADMANSATAKKVDEVKKDNQEAKEQASESEVPRSDRRAQVNSDYENLVRRTRSMGSDSLKATAERLRIMREAQSK